MSPRFRHRVEAIVEKIADMEKDLARERKAMNRLWAKREAQIRGVIDSTVGIYGDLQGIVGRALQQIEGLDIPLLESSADDESDDVDEMRKAHPSQGPEGFPHTRAVAHQSPPTKRPEPGPL
jgi:Uncharacterized protein conserved in bacteria (DUF2130)